MTIKKFFKYNFFFYFQNNLTVYLSREQDFHYEVPRMRRENKILYNAPVCPYYKCLIELPSPMVSENLNIVSMNDRRIVNEMATHDRVLSLKLLPQCVMNLIKEREKICRNL